MTPEQFTEIQSALGYDCGKMAEVLGLSERMVVFMRSGQRRISSATAIKMKAAIKSKIDELKLLHRFLK